jgi:uncharacterized lipoprotein YddW (UPF0748 family)
VDTFVQEVQKAIRNQKPWVRFGISPFGIWRPGNPKPVTGLDAYDVLYADARKWLQSGWVDYMVPQLYWAIDAPGQSFPALLEWWEDQNTRQRHLWIGLNSAKVGDPWPSSEILNQIELTRQFGLNGHVHYHIGKFKTHPTFASALRAAAYSEPALPPATPWLDDRPPPRPRLDVIEGPSWRAVWTPGDGEPAWQWLLQIKRGNRWESLRLPGNTREQTLGPRPDALALRALDRCSNLSPVVVESLKP